MRGKLILLVVVILLAVSLACNFSTNPIHTITLLPSNSATTAKDNQDYAASACLTPCPSHTINCWSTSGTVTAGYTYQSDVGTDPCPCWWYLDCAQRGVVIFDLWPLLGKGIVSAELTYDVTSDIDLGTTATNENNCLARVVAANGPTDTFATYGEELASFPTVEISGLEGPINLAPTVRSWVDGSLPNNGLLFIGFDESLPTDQNRHCFAEITNVQLTVLYTD